jgi:hypothetical protein
MKRPSFPVTRAAIPSGPSPWKENFALSSARSFRIAAAKSPSWGTEALHPGRPSSAKTIFKLVEPMFIPNDRISPLKPGKTGPVLKPRSCRTAGFKTVITK